jgi:hypothetical protein
VVAQVVFQILFALCADAPNAQAIGAQVYKGGDREILEQYRAMKREIDTYLAKQAAEVKNSSQKG